MSRLFSDPFSLAAAAIVAFSFLSAFRYQWKVRRNGIETTAVVTEAEMKELHDSDGISRYCDYHVFYTDRNGNHIEGILANALHPLEEGEKIVIRYTEEKPESPVYIRKA